MNLFPALDAATEAALRESIERFGVLVPIVKDQNGNILDGNHRSKLADELKVSYRVDVITVSDEHEANEIQRTLNADRRQLDPEQRKEIVAALREKGHSLRAIAGAIGASKSQVANDVDELSTTGQLKQPERVKSIDGKSRPAKRPSVVAAKNPREAERAQEALATAPAPAGRVIDVKRAERIAREAEAETRRSKPVAPITESDDITTLHGDFREVLSDKDLVGGVVITDPPYPREFLDLWTDLGQSALDWGCDSLIAMTGQSILPDALDAILRASGLPGVSGQQPRRWRYRWTGAYLTVGPATRVWGANVGTSWKPILAFDLDDEREFLTTDVFRSTGDDKDHHYWGQNENGIAALVEAFSSPGDLVIDPFLGGGTTAVVCKVLGRRFIGCDVDGSAVDVARERLAA